MLLATQVLDIKSPVAVAGATLVAAALFSPLRARVQRLVDRRFNRARYDADQTVAAFASRLQDAVDLDGIRADLLSVVYRSLEPAHLSVWFPPDAATARATPRGSRASTASSLIHGPSGLGIGIDIKSTLTTTMANMTTPQTTAGEASGAIPVACTLTSADRAAQAGRWEQLIARAMTERTETADGLHLSFRPEPGVEEELRRLVAVENECCRWAAWAVETNAEATVLDVRSTGPGIATLHGMFRPAQAR